MSPKRLLVLSLTIVLAGTVFAGGPLDVTGPAATNPGRAFVWAAASLPIKYTVDTGPMSVSPSGQTVVSNSSGLARVKSLFQNWQSVSTTTISYAYAGPITASGLTGGDVKTLADFNAVQGVCKSGTQNPIVFDADGSIVRGLGLDPLVIGFASPCKLDLQAGHIVSGTALLNGQFQDGVTNSSTSNFELTADQFNEAMTHEFGHFSGLDHSQINVDVFEEQPGSCDLDTLAGLPLMFPIEYCQSRKSAGLPILSPDDVAWISKLYPKSNFATSYGTISGRVFFSDGITQAQGVNVIARRADDPATPEDESKRIAVSVVSGFEFTGNPGQSVSGTNTVGSSFGSRNPTLIGYFEVSVPPGTYNVQIEGIHERFQGGSGVGPLNPPAPTFFPSDFWNQYESAFDDTTVKDPVVVQAGQTVGNIDIILNGTGPRFDKNEDGEVELRRPVLDRFFRRPSNIQFLGSGR